MIKINSVDVFPDWKWDPDKYDPKYHEILRLFQDKKSSCYSIQQIGKWYIMFVS